jgi:hypothetical protein
MSVKDGDPTAAADGSDDAATRIAFVPELKGLLVYATTIAFAALYVHFIWDIVSADGREASLSGAEVSAAGALAGVLGAAFALVIGVPNREEEVNTDARDGREWRLPKMTSNRKRLRAILSIRPRTVSSSSIPLTVGIWVYAAVAGAVAMTYVLNQRETPPSVRGLAVAFGGYVVAFLASAYHVKG